MSCLEMRCPVCNAEMLPLCTSVYCPNECEKKETEKIDEQKQQPDGTLTTTPMPPTAPLVYSIYILKCNGQDLYDNAAVGDWHFVQNVQVGDKCFTLRSEPSDSKNMYRFKHLPTNKVFRMWFNQSPPAKKFHEMFTEKVK